MKKSPIPTESQNVKPGPLHSDYDFKEIVAQAQLVIDTRNSTRDIAADRSKIFLA